MAATDFALQQTIGGYNYQLTVFSDSLELIATTTVPEPQTWAEFLAAAALLGLWGRRRAKSPANTISLKNAGSRG